MRRAVRRQLAGTSCAGLGEVVTSCPKLGEQTVRQLKQAGSCALGGGEAEGGGGETLSAPNCQPWSPCSTTVVLPLSPFAARLSSTRPTQKSSQETEA